MATYKDLGVKRVYPQRTGEKEIAIRACAAKIMAAYAVGQEPDLKEYTMAVRRAAWRLLVYERIVTRATGFQLTASGKSHVEKHGPVVYPKREKP